MFNLFKPFDLFKIGSGIASGMVGNFTISITGNYLESTTGNYLISTGV